MPNPRSWPIEELTPHKLCRSPASEGWLILFSVTQASIVTSAIATPALAVIKDNMAHTSGKFGVNAGTSMAMEPTKPENSYPTN